MLLAHEMDARDHPPRRDVVPIRRHHERWPSEPVVPVSDQEEFTGPSWKVERVQTSRGFGAPSWGAPTEDLIGLTLWCVDLDSPGSFVFAPDDAEQTALALLDTVRLYREEQR